MPSLSTPLAQAVQIMEYLDTLPVIYDCFMENWGWMTKGMQDSALEFAPDRHYLNMLREFRTPVPELKAYLLERGKDVQKIQLFTKDMRLRQSLLRELEQRFADLSVSSSVVNNVEINNIHANKGEALQQLADYLQLGISQTMAFGDGLNDCSMIRQAGIGVAMGNACPEVKAAADQMTKSCDEDGVATAILKILD